MLDEETLLGLKLKLPLRYTKPIRAAYKKRTDIEISRWTVMRFFEGLSYSEDLHLAVLDVASAQQSLIDKTTEAINA